MNLLQGLIGGAAGAEMATVVSGLIEKHGGVQGLVSQFERSGFGPTIQSWVGNGANQPITPAQVHQAVGPSVMGELAAKTGLSSEDLASKLATLLPQAVNALTPNGKV
jgi:uncharacterized protein YidB (DUF937 family)